MRTSLTLTKPQHIFLKQEARKWGVSVGEMIRRIIDGHREEKAIANLGVDKTKHNT